MPLESMAATHGGLDAFRLATPSEVATTLRQLQDGAVLVNLNAPRGGIFMTTLWAVDTARRALSFAAEADDPQLQALLEGDEATVVAYLENIKVQFDVHNLLLVRGLRTSALSTSYPRELFRFQRRDSYRVRLEPRDTPVARMRHPMIPDMQLALRILDVSVGGCALLLPQDVPPLAPGVLVNRVLLELDLGTLVETALRLHHVTSIHTDSQGVRLGCEMVGLSQDAERLLQRYIDQTQKRRRFTPLE